MARHGRHWPREEQNANAWEGFGDLSGDDAAAARVHAKWAPVFPPIEMPIDPYQPEFNNEPYYREVIRYGREQEGC